jgi:hypothetical protein
LNAADRRVARLATTLQRRLEASYRLPPGPDVARHLTHDAGLRTRLLGPDAAPVAEELLLLEEDGALYLALYLECSARDALAEYDPSRGLDAANLQAFLHLVEGVSHFRYVVDRAASQRCLSLLELELQAEIDKYVLLVQWLQALRHRPAHARIRSLLYEHNCFLHAPGTEAGERYRLAARYAGRWSARLGRQLPGWRESQRLWRLPLAAKLYHIGHFG